MGSQFMAIWPIWEINYLKCWMAAYKAQDFMKSFELIYLIIDVACLKIRFYCIYTWQNSNKVYRIWQNSRTRYWPDIHSRRVYSNYDSSRLNSFTQDRPSLIGRGWLHKWACRHSCETTETVVNSAAVSCGAMAYIWRCVVVMETI